MSKDKPKVTLRKPPPASSPSIEDFVSGAGAAPVAAMAREADRLVVTTFRVTSAQLSALQREALQRKEGRGHTGKADASEVLRDILNHWMKG